MSDIFLTLNLADTPCASDSEKAALTAALAETESLLNEGGFLMELLDSEGCPWDDPAPVADIPEIVSVLADVAAEPDQVRIRTKRLRDFIAGKDLWTGWKQGDVLHIFRRR